jgi:hypothetical protein
LLLEGLNSGDPIPANPEYWTELKREYWTELKRETAAKLEARKKSSK